MAKKTVLVINPNTSEEMTESIGQSAARAASDAIETITVCAAYGPRSIESELDDALAVPGVIEAAVKLGKEFHALVIACFGDPGMAAVKSVFDVPAIGIAQASMTVAGLIGGKFGILSIGAVEQSAYHHLVARYGMSDSYLGTGPAEITVLGLESQDFDAERTLVPAAQDLKERGASSILLGCAGMGKTAAFLTERVGVPCIDPVEAGVQVAELALRYSRNSSKKLKKRPNKKELLGYPGLSSLFEG